jgi:hypothetical protein
MYDIAKRIIDDENFVKTIDKVHAEVHEGATYSNSVSTTVIAASTYFIALTSSAAYYPHFQFMIYASAAATVGLYESPTMASTWAVTDSMNHYRPSTRAATMAVRNNVPSSDVTSTGTLLEAISLGGGATPASIFGGDASNRHEWVFDKSKNYLIKINSVSTNTIVFTSNWYED